MYRLYLCRKNTNFSTNQRRHQEGGKGEAEINLAFHRDIGDEQQVCFVWSSDFFFFFQRLVSVVYLPSMKRASMGIGV